MHFITLESPGLCFYIPTTVPHNRMAYVYNILHYTYIIYEYKNRAETEKMYYKNIVRFFDFSFPSINFYKKKM